MPIDLDALSGHEKMTKIFMAKLQKIDANGDGVIDEDEAHHASQSAIDAIRDQARGNSQWDVVRELALLRGEYKALDSTFSKGMDPGEGGRFAIMVDILRDRGYSEEQARSLAVAIGKSKYKWMR